MVMRLVAVKWLTLLMLVVFGLAPIHTFAQNTDTEKTGILSAARQRYYNLRQAGLIEFQANIQPNWEVLLASTKAKGRSRTMLESLHFSFSIDSEGKLRLEHHADTPPRSPTSAAGVEKIFNGMDESVSSFFGTWSIFLLTSPFPKVDSDYAIDQIRGRGHRFSQRQGDLFVEVDTDNDFVITEIRVSGPELTASLKPVLEKTPSGFLLKGYTANSQRLSGARSATVKALLEYETVSGLQLLRKVSLDTTFEGVPTKFEWLFTEYQVKVR